MLLQISCSAAFLGVRDAQSSWVMQANRSDMVRRARAVLHPVLEHGCRTDATLFTDPLG
jgi:hypothetical protein